MAYNYPQMFGEPRATAPYPADPAMAFAATAALQHGATAGSSAATAPGQYHHQPSTASTLYHPTPTMAIQYQLNNPALSAAVQMFPATQTQHLQQQQQAGPVAAAAAVVDYHRTGCTDAQDGYTHKRKRSSMTSVLPTMMPSVAALMPPPLMDDARKYAYKPANMHEIFGWYMTRQNLYLCGQGHRAIVENLIIYLEGLNVTYRNKDISLSESVNWNGAIEYKGGPLPQDSFKDALTIDGNPHQKKTSSFITNTITNFLHSGSIGNLCMIETVSSYFIPIRTSSGLTESDIYQEPGQKCKPGVGYKKLNGGYSSGECGSLLINSDGTYTLKSYGIIIVIGADFTASTCRPVMIERLTTSSIRLLHPSGNFHLPKHIQRYPNKPVTPNLTLPSTVVPGTRNVMMEYR